MKKLGIALLAFAFSVPMFAAQTKSASTAAAPQTQTETKGKVVRRKAKNTKKRYHKKTTQPAPAAKPAAAK